MAKITAPPVEQTLEAFAISTDTLTPSDVEAKLTEDVAEDALSAEEASQLYEEVAAIDAAIETLTGRREQIKAAFRRLPRPDGKKTVQVHESGGTVTLGSNPIFQEAKFLVDFPYDFEQITKVVETDRDGEHIVSRVTFPNRHLYKISPDRPAIRAALGEEAKEYFAEGEARVTIK